MKGIIFLVLLVALGWYAYSHYRHSTRSSADSAVEPLTLSTAEPAQFQCDGRSRCSQMTSCAEATFFLKHCPNTQMDGDHDGIPCERQWCN